MPTTDTNALVAGALDGDREARELLLERLRPRLVLWSAARMSPALRAKLEPQDLAQDVLLAVHEGLDGVRGREPRVFFAWVFRIAENRLRDAADHWDAQKRRPRPPDSFTQTSPSDRARVAESVSRLRAAIEGLPEVSRSVIRLMRLEERPVGEVAAEMGRSENAVRILYCRALKLLRKALPEEP